MKHDKGDLEGARADFTHSIEIEPDLPLVVPRFSYMAAADPLHLDVLLAHEPLVRAAARAILRGDPEVDDVVQDTWLAALHDGPRDVGAAPAWLRKVARHRALNVIRDRRRRAAREGAAVASLYARDVASIAEREAIRRQLVEALLEQPEPYRSVLLMRFYDDLPPRRIARRLGVPVETVKTQIKRGLARMRERLGGASEDGVSRPRARLGLGLVGLAGWSAPMAPWWISEGCLWERSRSLWGQRSWRCS